MKNKTPNTKHQTPNIKHQTPNIINKHEKSLMKDYDDNITISVRPLRVD